MRRYKKALLAGGFATDYRSLVTCGVLLGMVGWELACDVQRPPVSSLNHHPPQPDPEHPGDRGGVREMAENSDERVDENTWG